MRRALLVAAVVCLTVLTAKAQDPVKVDPKHHKVEFENDQVRALRITLGPHEKTPMHEHPAHVIVFLTDSHVKLTLPRGKTQERGGKAGETRWVAGGKHVSENLSDKPYEIVVVELKAKPAVAKAQAPKKKS